MPNEAQSLRAIMPRLQVENTTELRRLQKERQAKSGVANLPYLLDFYSPDDEFLEARDVGLGNPRAQPQFPD